MRATLIILTGEERNILESRVRNGKTEQRLALRARIILAAAAGQKSVHIAQALGNRPATVSKWRRRFAQDGLAGLEDAPRAGKPRTYNRDTEKRVLSQLGQPPPLGFAHWNGRLLAAALGEVSKH